MAKFNVNSNAYIIIYSVVMVVIVAVLLSATSLSLQERVREVYIESAERDSELLVVDCSNDEGTMASPDEIFARIEKTIAPLLNR